MKLEAIVNHETSRIHSTCIVASRAQAQQLFIINNKYNYFSLNLQSALTTDFINHHNVLLCRLNVGYAAKLNVASWSSTTVTMWHGGSGACTAASQQEGHVFDSRMGCCWLWGAGSPQTLS